MGTGWESIVEFEHRWSQLKGHPYFQNKGREGECSLAWLPGLDGKWKLDLILKIINIGVRK